MYRKKKPSKINTTEPKAKKKSFLMRLFKWFFYLFSIITVFGGLGLVSLYLYLSKDLPKISTLNDYRPPVITTVYSDNNKKIGEFYKERRIVIPLSQIPPMLINAFIAAEDARFFEHKGIDAYSIIRALSKNIKAGSIVQGGSTITQQVAKSSFFQPFYKFISNNICKKSYIYEF